MLTAGGLLLFALEGVICIAMAAPIALTIVIVGALIGRAVAIHGRPATASLLVVVASVPLLGLAEGLAVAPVLHEVVTTIEIDAPPEVAWAHVIGFADLPPPTDWVFRPGIAYPIRARIIRIGCWRRQILRVLDRCLHRADHDVGSRSATGLRRPQPAARDAGMELLRRRAPAASGHAASEPQGRVPPDQAR